MTTTYYIELNASRIADSDGNSQSAADDGDVIDWAKENEFILATLVGTSKGPIDRQYKLRWRNVTDEGTFADVAGSGEIKWAASAETALVDGNAVTTPICTGTPKANWQNGLQSEEDNTLPDAGTYSLADEYYTEFQWGLNADDALDGHQYEFELYEITNGVSIGTCLAQITMYIEPPPMPDGMYERNIGRGIGRGIL